MAAAAGIDVIALTDHAETRGWPEVAIAAARAGLSAIPGVELNTSGGDLLGYLFDPHHAGLRSFLAEIRRWRAGRIRRVLARLHERGLPLDAGELAAQSAPGPISRTTIARALVAQGHIPDIDVAFQHLLGRRGAAYVPAIAPTPEAACAAIKEAGGLLVAAHPRYHLAGRSSGYMHRWFARLRALGVAAVERTPAPSGGPTSPRESALEAAVQGAAQEAGLLLVGGSNFHGDGVTRARFGRPAIDGEELRALVGHLPPRSPMRGWLKRLRWRVANLTDDELVASFTPTRVVLPELPEAALMIRPAPAVTQHSGPPFVLIGPGAFGRTAEIVQSLRALGCTSAEVIRGPAFPPLAWDLYSFAEKNRTQQLRAAMRFGLDRQLHGEQARRCDVVSFQPPPGHTLRQIKIALRRALGPVRFYRVEFGGMVEEAVQTFLHIPDAHRVSVERAILTSHLREGATASA